MWGTVLDGYAMSTAGAEYAFTRNFPLCFCTTKQMSMRLFSHIPNKAPDLRLRLCVVTVGLSTLAVQVNTTTHVKLYVPSAKWNQDQDPSAFHARMVRTM